MRLRICPGRHLAMDSVWFAMAAILSLFDVSKPVGDSDKGIEFTDGLVRYSYHPILV